MNTQMAGRQALKSVGTCSDGVRFISTSSALFLSYADENTDGTHAGGRSKVLMEIAQMAKFVTLLHHQHCSSVVKIKIQTA